MSKQHQIPSPNQPITREAFQTELNLVMNGMGDRVLRQNPKYFEHMYQDWRAAREAL